MLRRLCFHIKERLVHAGLQDVLEEMRRNDRLSPVEMESRRRELLVKTMQVAAHTPYYQRAIEQTGIDAFDPDSLRKLPPLTKREAQQNSIDLRSPLNSERLRVTMTSGSTGTPGRFYRSRLSNLWGYASGVRCKEWWGIAPSAPVLRLWGRSAQFSTSARKRTRAAFTDWKDWACGTLNILSYNLSHENIDRHWRTITRWRPKVIHGYASAAYMLARLLLETGRDGRSLGLAAIITEGEKLFASQRSTLDKAFGCPVLEWYGCCEVGIVATPCEYNKLHIRQDMVHLETVDGVIHLTTLREYAAPLLRYRVDDHGEIDAEPCPCGRPTAVLAALHGRTCDMIRRIDGSLVHPWAFDHIMKQAGVARKYTFVQKTLNRVEVQLETSERVDTGTLGRISQQIRDQLGDAVNVDIKLVDRISTDASGKFRWIRSELPANGSVATI